MRLIGCALAVALSLPAAVASAEPDRVATLNGSNPTFTWESAGSGVPDPSGSQLRCTGALFRCEHILLHVETGGELTLTLDSANGVDVGDPTGEVCDDSPCAIAHDLDGYLYRSTSAGEILGTTLTRDCVSSSPSETCKVAVEPGFYLVEVEYYLGLESSYIGTTELDVAAPSPPVAERRMITLDDCNFTLYYFQDSAERLQARVPPGYRVRPYSPALSPLVTAEGSATIAAAAYDCGRIEIPGSSPAPAIFTVLSVLVYPPDGTEEGPALSDFYVLWIHANHPQLVELLASRGMPAHLVPGMAFEKPLQSLAVRVEVPWSLGAYELATTGFQQDLFHDHDNTYLHVAADGRLARMDFVTHRVRDQFCFEPSDHHAAHCGKLTTRAGTPIASFFGGPDRTADNAWDHNPIERSWLLLHEPS